MNPGQHRHTVTDVAHSEDHVLLASEGILKTVHVKDTPVGREARGFYVTYRHSVIPS
jgi:hypothetical protein